jgi:hypothetical protein
MADRKQDELDRALDAALAKYAAIEPRAGLEDRVLANLRAERSRIPERGWWRWGIAGALAAVVVVALALAWRSGKPTGPVVANHSPDTTQGAKEPTRLVVSGDGANQPPLHASDSAKRRTTNLVRRETVVAVNSKLEQPKPDQPKLDQFPSPRPLSEQEKILQSYVAEYPQKAVLIARARSEALQHDLEELKMKAFASGQGPGDPNEQNHDTTER